MKICNALDNPKNSKAIDKFNTWFVNKQINEGLQYIHISLHLEDGRFDGKRHFMSYFPKWIRNIYSRRYIDKILNNFVDVQEGLDNDTIETKTWTDEELPKAKPKMTELF